MEDGQLFFSIPMILLTLPLLAFSIIKIIGLGFSSVLIADTIFQIIGLLVEVTNIATMGKQEAVIALCIVTRTLIFGL